MSYIEASKNSDKPVKIFYEDWGEGQPIVFIHGWPLSHEMWEYQLADLPKHGLRCIAYDRRGFGKSDKPWDGYDYDTLATDLKALLDELDLNDVILVGFSMGGGEVVRYLSRYGRTRIAKVVLVSAVTPLLLGTDSNPQGLNKEIFEGMLYNIKEDRPNFLSRFGKQFFGVNLVNHPVSPAFLEWNLMLALQASPKATVECLKSFSETDFHEDLKSVNVPTLIIHGDDDDVVPIKLSGELTWALIQHSEYIVYSGSPHGLYYTDKEKLNSHLLTFIRSIDVPLINKGEDYSPPEIFSETGGPTS